MRKFALATAAIAALAFSVPAFTAPAAAQDVKVRINSGGHRDHGRHEGWRHRDVNYSHDRGRHEGWRHHSDRGVTKKVIIRQGQGGTSKTVIKKRTEG